MTHEIHDLVNAPGATPTEQELIAVKRAVAVAFARGLDLPDRLHIHWRVLQGDIHGAAQGDVIYLGLGPGPPDLRGLARVTLHECAHVHDFRSGYPRTAPDWEARAERFADWMLSHWDRGTVPRRATRAHGVAPFHLPPSDPADDGARAATLRADIERRITRLARLRPADERALRAILVPIRELEAIATRGDAQHGG